MNKVRRGDLPAAVEVTGTPANLSFGTKLATPVSSKGPQSADVGTGAFRELTSADSMETPTTDE